MHLASEAVLLRNFLHLLFRTVSSSIFHALSKKCPGESQTYGDLAAEKSTTQKKADAHLTRG
jgi:hypothetical protein